MFIKAAAALLPLAVFSPAQAEVSINDDSGTVKISDVVYAAPSDFVFGGMATDPIEAVLLVDRDTVFDVSQGSVKIQGSGAIKTAEGVSLVFENGVSSRHGGALYANLKTFSVSGTSGNLVLFKNNSSVSADSNNPYGGGAIGMFMNSTVMDIAYARFEGNVATGESTRGIMGGAIMNYQGFLTVRDSIFEGNEANSSSLVAVGGGALGVMLSGGGTAAAGTSVFGGSFVGNRAVANYNSAGSAAYGGAIIAQQQVLTVEGAQQKPVLFENNKAENRYGGLAYGGAVALLKGTEATFSHVEFKGNSAFNARNENGFGGAAFLENSGCNSEFSNAVFDGNKASYGGAVYRKSGNLAIDGALFSGNTALADGGAIYLDGSGANNSASVSNADFIGNEGANGGAIYAGSGQNLTLTDVNITGNVASGKGAAVYAQVNTLTINVSASKTANISGNKNSAGDADGIYLHGGAALVVNTAAGGVLNMADPLGFSGTGAARVTKTGAGTWKIGGANMFASSSASDSTNFSVSSGTVEMLSGATVEMRGVNSVFKLEASAILDLRGVSAANSLNVAEGAFILDGGSKVRFDAANLNADTALVHAAVFDPDADIDGKILIEIDGLPEIAPEGRYALFTFEDSMVYYEAGDDAGDLFALIGANSSNYHFEWGDGALYIVHAVPEPAVVAAFAGLLALAFAAFRKRK